MGVEMYTNLIYAIHVKGDDANKLVDKYNNTKILVSSSKPQPVSTRDLKACPVIAMDSTGNEQKNIQLKYSQCISSIHDEMGNFYVNADFVLKRVPKEVYELPIPVDCIGDLTDRIGLELSTTDDGELYIGPVLSSSYNNGIGTVGFGFEHGIFAMDDSNHYSELYDDDFKDLRELARKADVTLENPKLLLIQQFN